jgi:hypothetical protein
MTRRDGEFVVTAPDGRRVWGPADPAFRSGLPGPVVSPREPAPTAEPVSVTRLLFPAQAPDLPDAMPVNGEPMDLGYVVGVLLGNRDLERRLAAENAGRLAAVA